MKQTGLLIMVLLICVTAYAVDNRIKQTEMLYDGDATDPALYWGGEGETDTGEGEEDGWIHSPEGEKGIGWVVDNAVVGTVQSDGVHADITGDISGGDITADTITMSEGEGEGVITGYLVGNVLGDLTGDVNGGDIVADTITMSEGEGEGVITGYLVGNVTGDLTGDVNGGDIVADTITMSEGEGEGVITGYLVGNVTGALTGNSAGTHTGAVSLPDGAEGEPSDYYTNDTNTGRYRIGADEMGWVTGGTLRLSLSTTALTSTLPILIPSGSSGADGLAFASDPDTGIYLFGANALALSGGDTIGLIAASTYMQSFLQHIFATGSIASPSITFAGDTNTGFYGNAADTVGLTLGGVLAATYGVGADTRIHSGGEYTSLHTNYYAGTAHNSVTYRATRGTSASPDYLDSGDALGYLKWEAMDGSGTWGDGASIRVEALEDHSAGDTGSEVVFYATPERGTSDTQERVAAVGSYDLLTAYDLPALDCSLFYPRTAGAGWLFGYIGDLAGLGAYTGLVMISDSTGQIPVMLGEDTYMYFGDGAGNVLADDTWRIGGDGSDGFTAEQHDSSGDTWTKHFRVSENGAEVNSDEAFYLGDPDTDGSWRIIRDGNNLVHQRRESSTWTTKDTITP